MLAGDPFPAWGRSRAGFQEQQLIKSLSTDLAPATQSPPSCRRAFVLAAPSTWKALPSDPHLTCAPSSSKCHLLGEAFPDHQATAAPAYFLLHRPAPFLFTTLFGDLVHPFTCPLPRSALESWLLSGRGAFLLLQHCPQLLAQCVVHSRLFSSTRRVNERADECCCCRPCGCLSKSPHPHAPPRYQDPK